MKEPEESDTCDRNNACSRQDPRQVPRIHDQGNRNHAEQIGDSHLGEHCGQLFTVGLSFAS
ncbi:hypothetical protein GALL_334980 [mine drainage metagenome]|uniref:Uncharacterized protein n=1 Tax=mine drainage metagenome TaxID=410659 RepID=A0A1J5QXW8_9ZZZZ